MIVRILGEGQYDVADDAARRAQRARRGLEAAVEAGDEDGVPRRADALLDGVRDAGAPLARRLARRRPT